MVDSLEAEIDHLLTTINSLKCQEPERLRRLQLESLAELAAGAGHEINNPLAVISGQGQYLLNRETDPDRQRSLQTIIRQTHRIHQILTEMMQFARPGKPNHQPVNTQRWIQDVIDEMHDLLEQKEVRVEWREASEPLPLLGDTRQLHLALAGLVRNAIEAAPKHGWVRIELLTPIPGELRLHIEDNGPGPIPEQVEHLFDPFYSGRQAGRGRGMGLPIAWRMARSHGGDLWYEPLADGPTRFVLRLPLAPKEPAAGWSATEGERRSA
jgi:signal transduction histidine kinase